MDRMQEREREIDAAVADIRAIGQRDGITRASLAKIRQRLIRFARARLSQLGSCAGRSDQARSGDPLSGVRLTHWPVNRRGDGARMRGWASGEGVSVPKRRGP